MNPRLVSAWVVSLLVALLAGCSTHDPSISVSLRADAGAEGEDEDSGNEEDDDAGSGPGWSDPADDAGASAAVDAAVVRTLSIEPRDPTLSVSGTAATLALTALLDGTALAKASWSVDSPSLGAIGQDGVFRSAGLVAGAATVSARYGDLTATTTIRVTASLTHTAPGVSDVQKTALDAAPTSADAAFAWLYPYDGTVFPRGLAGPDMQFAGTAPDALRISLEMGPFRFKGYFPGTSPGAVKLPAEVWDALTLSADGMEPVRVEVTKVVGANVIAPISQTWRIAPGDLKGVIYYNTYKSASTATGAVMRIRPGQDAEVMLGGCTVCHSVSAQGNVLAAGVNWGAGDPLDSATFDLQKDGSAPSRLSDTDGRKFAFAGLTPDGRYLINNGVPDPSPIRGVVGPLESKLLDTKTGLEVSAASFTSKVKFAVTPAFSPDEKRLAFSWYDSALGKTLAMMDVDLSMSPPAFAAPQTVATVTSGIVGWPSFFPDGKGIVYQEGDGFDTAGYGGTPSYAELRLADTSSMAVRKLEALNGWRDATNSYLPYGKDEENRRNYEPSVLPVPVGGYYWVIFTSRRAYGHTLAPNGTVAGSDDEWGKLVNNAEVPSVRKKLWVAAIDIDYNGKVDPSHPAFYLPGQELNAGNMRAYTALEPCHAQGDKCQSGADCCGGFCRWESIGDVGEPTPTCVPPPVGCSNVDETCKTDADCCGAARGHTCINHRCAVPNVFLQ